MNQDEWEHQGVVHLLDVVARRNADRRERQVGEPRVLGVHLFQAALVGDDPPVRVWLVSAGVPLFCSPATWAGVVLAEEESGVRPPRLVSDESEPYCEGLLLLRVRARWVWPVGTPDDWLCDLALGQQLVEVSAARVPGIGVQPVSEEAAFGEAPCERASVAVLLVSARSSGVQPPAVFQVLRERRAVQAAAAAMQQRGLVPLVQEPVSAALA